ncbi:hypothetical protein AAC387_Pa10g1583 [Persea americana]
MGSEDFIDLPAFGVSEDGNEDDGLHNSNSEQSEADGQPGTSPVIDSIPNIENMGQSKGVCATEDDQHSEDMDLEVDAIQEQPILQESIEVAATITTIEKINGDKTEPASENICPVTLDDRVINRDQREGSHVSGVKRARMTCDQQPSVCVIYNSLRRDSKRKLEDLLHQWSEWHAQYVSSSNDLSKETLEYGEETYFPAIHVGLEKSSTVSFWMDSQARPTQSKESTLLESNSVPLYDRGYALGLTSLDKSTNPERVIGTVDASRCFNCGSYNHSLKECPKPRDNAAVNSARKQHNSKRNLPAGSRLPTRYYQNSPGGKFDGLRAGVLGAETRQCLGIGEFDPPPWFNRMREIGYPPGYLDSEGQDQPSGITIYADEETKEEHEDGEILDTGELEPPEKKMTVVFPGINAPIPENADHRRWAASPASSNRSHSRSNRSSEGSKGHYHDQRRTRDYRDDGPPGVDQGFNRSTSIYGKRYSGHDSNYQMESQSPRANYSIPRSPSLGRSLSDRGWKSPLVHEGSPGHSPHSPLPHSSSSMSKYPPQNYGPPRF